MILLRLILLIGVSLAVGCEMTPKIPEGTKQNYPAIIKDSSDRRAKAEREWRRLLDAYNAPQTPPDFYPITNTPRSLLGVSGGIAIMTTKPEAGSENIAVREAFKRFVGRWQELIGADPTALSLTSAAQDAGTHRLTYRQANYPFPVAGNYGEMVAVINSTGQLLQLDDRFIPVVELPLRPSLEREAAAKLVVGRTYTYSDLAGREQRVRINSINEVSVKRLVALPVEKGDLIEVHLAWEIVAGQSLNWTVYIDAVNGEEVKVVQNFNT